MRKSVRINDLSEPLMENKDSENFEQKKQTPKFAKLFAQ